MNRREIHNNVINFPSNINIYKKMRKRERGEWVEWEERFERKREDRGEKEQEGKRVSERKETEIVGGREQESRRVRERKEKERIKERKRECEKEEWKKGVIKGQTTPFFGFIFKYFKKGNTFELN